MSLQRTKCCKPRCSSMRVVALALCAAAAVAPTLAQDAPAAQGPPEVALVSTADELRTALDLGTKHVQVIEHLDLRTLPNHPEGDGEQLLRPKPTTRSITGNCSTNAEEIPWLANLQPPMARHRSRQCVLFTARDLIFWDVVNPGSSEEPVAINVWLSRLHIRAQRTPDPGNTIALVFWRPWEETGGSFWGSFLTIQGDGQPRSRCMYVQNAPAYLESSTFIDGNENATLFAYNGNVTIRNTRLARNTALRGQFELGYGTAAFATHYSMQDNRGPTAHLDGEALFVHDEPRASVTLSNDSTGTVVQWDGGDPGQFLQRANPVYTQLRQESEAATMAEHARLAPADDGGTAAWKIGVGVTAAALVVAAAALCAALWCRRRRNRRTQQTKQKLPTFKSTQSESARIHAHTSMRRNMATLSSPDRTASLQALAKDSSSQSDATATASKTLDRTVSFVHVGALPRLQHKLPTLTSAFTDGSTTALQPTLGGKSDMEKLHRALENIALSEPPELFAGRFVLLPGFVIGGQGMVCFARSKDGGFRQFAIKFFPTLADYECECALYSRAALAHVLPALVQAVPNDDYAVRSRSGYAFPPFIVMDRGVTLHAWKETHRRFPAVLGMALELAELLATLHEAGQVHRDLKPANVLLSMHTQEWRLLDLGAAATIGTKALPRCTLTYAPPEAVVACLSAEPIEVEVHPSLDVWSLGVMAYECLAQERAFAHFSGRDAILACARGEQRYPWEAPEGELNAAWANSSARKHLEACLSRDPARRPSAAEVQANLNVLGDAT